MRTMRRRSATLFFACALLGSTAPATADDPETQVLAAWQQWQDGDSRGAGETLERLLVEQPKFRLARLLQAELLAARAAGRLQRPLALDDPRIAELTGELQRRLAAKARSLERQPADLIYLPDRVRRAVAVDLSAGRLYLFERGADGNWRHLRDHYAAIGRSGMHKRDRGDLRTPVGVYRIGRFIPDAELPDLYGAGALTLDYPNAWDRAAGRAGDGIWIHGVPSDTYVRAPQSSEGCVTLANEDFIVLRDDVQPGTPVILAERLEWRSAGEVRAERLEWLTRLEDWRLARLSADPARLSELYAKQALAAKAREEHELELSAIELFRYPGESGLVLAQFRTESRNGKGPAEHRRLRQFWRQDDERWRIEREISG